MNVVRFLLTIYFLSVQCTLLFTQSSFIKHFDTINYEPTIRIVRRAASYFSDKEKILLKFQAFQKNFHLHVFKDYSVIHQNSELIVGADVQQINGIIPVRGYMENHQSSVVLGTIVNGIFRGTITPDITNHTSGKYYVEHSGYHFSENPGFHSIIYHDSHVNITDDRIHPGNQHSYCGLSKPDIAHSMFQHSMQHGIRNYSQKPSHSRSKRSANTKGTEHVCNLYLQSDTFLWKKVMSLHHVNGQHYLAVQEISSIFTQHVQGAQAIYQNTVFQTYRGSGGTFNGIGFRVDRVRINTTADCEEPLKKTNPFCSPNIDVTNFLNLNSYMKHDDFCLAYVFTYRDFSGGTLGLAWVAEPGGSGGVCEKNRMMQEAGWNVRKSLNTGIVTLLNYGSYVALKVSQLTFAHEMGHNFGSKHDDDHKDNVCLPSSDDPKGNYIMFASATSGERENNNKFSKCSQDSIARLLQRVVKSHNNCFSSQEGSFCGNKLTEEGEQCDCGYSSDDCKDKCCNPKKSKAPCKLTNVVMIRNVEKKVVCSPNAGECCSDDCQFISKNRICRSSGECYQEARCTGNQNKCPKSEKKPDLTRCHDNTRVCKNGECVGSVCESVPGWQECSIVREEGVTSDMLCFVACKENKPNAPCISTLDLQKNSKLRREYHQLAKSLMPKGQAIHLKSGSPCDNYHGYCDSFLRCRSVEADGPLARLKGMLFSSLMLNKVKRWTTQFWWAVMLILIGGIVFVGIFLKVCSKSTPSMDPSVRVRSRIKTHRHHNKSHIRSRHRHHHRSSSRRRTEAIVVNDTDPPARPPRSSLPVTQQPAPQRPLRHMTRPTSMFQNDIIQAEPVIRPMSMNIESDIEMHGLDNQDLPGYPPPAYESPLILPHQHGRGRGKKGHRHALNQQASRFH